MIFGLSCIPGSAIPEGPVPWTDKVVHVALYGTLGFLCARALIRRRGVAGVVVRAALLATVYGVTDELHQIFTPRRSCDWHDVVADAIGGLLGAMVAAGLATRRGKTRPTEINSSPDGNQP